MTQIKHKHELIRIFFPIVKYTDIQLCEMGVQTQIMDNYG